MRRWLSRGCPDPAPSRQGIRRDALGRPKVPHLRRVVGASWASWFWARTSTGGVVFGTLLREVVEAPSVVAGLDVAQLQGRRRPSPTSSQPAISGAAHPTRFHADCRPHASGSAPAARPWFRLEPQAVRHYPDATSEANAVRSALTRPSPSGLQAAAKSVASCPGGLTPPRSRCSPHATSTRHACARGATFWPAHPTSRLRCRLPTNPGLRRSLLPSPASTLN